MRASNHRGGARVTLFTGGWRCTTCRREWENQTQALQCARSHRFERYDTSPGGFTPPLLEPFLNAARGRARGRPRA